MHCVLMWFYVLYLPAMGKTLIHARIDKDNESYARQQTAKDKMNRSLSSVFDILIDLGIKELKKNKTKKQ